MVKLAHFPVRGELKRLAERNLLEENEVELFPDYSTTLASGVDDTVRNLRVLREHARPEEEEIRTRDLAIEQLTEEVRTLREELARVVESLKTKASKGALKRQDEALTNNWNKKVDNLFKLVGLIGTVLGLAIIIRGHG